MLPQGHSVNSQDLLPADCSAPDPRCCTTLAFKPCRHRRVLAVALTTDSKRTDIRSPCVGLRRMLVEICHSLSLPVALTWRSGLQHDRYQLFQQLLWVRHALPWGCQHGAGSGSGTLLTMIRKVCPGSAMHRDGAGAGGALVAGTAPP